MKNKLTIAIIFLALIISSFGCTNKENIVKNESKNIENQETLLSNVTETSTLDDKKNENSNIKQEETKEDDEKNHYDDIKIDNTIINDIYNANTNDALLLNYISYHVYKYAMDKNGDTVAYMEGYQDRPNNKVLRLKGPDYNHEYAIENLPYLVSIDNKKYVSVNARESSNLPEDFFLNQESELRKDVIEQLFNDKSLMIKKYDSFDIEKGDIESKITLTIEDKEFLADDTIDICNKKYNNLNKINSLIIDITYNNQSLAISDILVVALDEKFDAYPIYNYKVKYDEDVLSPIKLLNTEEGETVSFDLSALEKANTYEILKKEIHSLVIKKTEYASNNIDKTYKIYTDDDDYIVVYDGDMTHVKYEKKWYDILDGEINNAGKYSEYEQSPVIQVTNKRSLFDPQYNVITSYGKNDEGYIMQEYEKDGDVIRIETNFSLDDNVVRRIQEYKMKGSVKGDIISEIIVMLDEDTPRELDEVVDYIDEEGE